jgi:hypothetical protein
MSFPINRLEDNGIPELLPVAGDSYCLNDAFRSPAEGFNVACGRIAGVMFAGERFRTLALRSGSFCTFTIKVPLYYFHLLATMLLFYISLAVRAKREANYARRCRFPNRAIKRQQFSSP